MNEIYKLRIYLSLSGFIHLLPIVSLLFINIPALTEIIIEEIKLIEGIEPNAPSLVLLITHLLTFSFATSFLCFGAYLKKILIRYPNLIFQVLYFQIGWRIFEIGFYFFNLAKSADIKSLDTWDFRLLFTQIMFIIVHFFILQDCKHLSKKLIKAESR